MGLANFINRRSTFKMRPTPETADETQAMEVTKFRAVFFGRSTQIMGVKPLTAQGKITRELPANPLLNQIGKSPVEKRVLKSQRHNQGIIYDSSQEKSHGKNQG
jgi:hypothetical protein